MTGLLPRELEVLRIIIEDYIANAQPVGSRSVAKQSGLQLSPASMRNVMADLTDKGYLEQPHTSAGRVPTASAFRYYLNAEMNPRQLTGEEKKRISSYMSQAGLELSDVLGQTSKMLSLFSHQVAMVLSPSREDVRWREIGFNMIRPGLVLAMLVLDGGMVQNRLIEVEPDMTADDLIAFGNYLNAHFRGRSLAEARAVILAELEGATKRLQQMYARALKLARSVSENLDNRQLFIDGATYILDQAEFSDLGKIRELLRLLEERSRLLALLDRTIAEKGVKIMLDDEAEIDDLKGCGVVTSPYGDDSQSRGVVSVIGPMRMDYRKVVPLVDHIAKTLTELLKQRF
jgi:heat-inducible transcriptional repressor